MLVVVGVESKLAEVSWSYICHAVSHGNGRELSAGPEHVNRLPNEASEQFASNASAFFSVLSLLAIAHLPSCRGLFHRHCSFRLVQGCCSSA